METRNIRLRVKRQNGAETQPYWEEFEIAYKPQHNVISVLMEIRRNPLTRDGKPTTPVVWEASCLEEVCGACTMVINGHVRQACTALIDQLAAAVHADLWPDRTLLLDLPVSTGLERAKSRPGAPDRFESEQRAFFERVRAAYLQRAAREPQRIRVIDGQRSAAEVVAAALTAIADLLPAVSR